MQNFFSFEHFKELKLLAACGAMLIFTMVVIANTVEVVFSIWSWQIFIPTFLVHCAFCIVDEKRYFNLANWLISFPIMYIVAWFISGNFIIK